MKTRYNPKPLKDALLSVRMPSQLKERLAKIEQRTRVTPATMVLESLEAICHYVEKNGEIRMPFLLIPRRELELLQNRAGDKK
ncbi:MAG: ribbon-helix-helix domain-containing protein [Verrucomicrobiales bacterium]|jgi:hypothetical protein|nr:ribbon-helix-helix domain-containing protein [Verrucomicrobiales bacterium]